MLAKGPLLSKRLKMLQLPLLTYAPNNRNLKKTSKLLYKLKAKPYLSGFTVLLGLFPTINRLKSTFQVLSTNKKRSNSGYPNKIKWCLRRFSLQMRAPKWTKKIILSTIRLAALKLGWKARRFCEENRVWCGARWPTGTRSLWKGESRGGKSACSKSESFLILLLS